MSLNFNLPNFDSNPDDGFNEIRQRLNHIINSQQDSNMNAPKNELEIDPTELRDLIEEVFNYEPEYCIAKENITIGLDEEIKLDITTLPEPWEEIVSGISVINIGPYFENDVKTDFFQLKVKVELDPKLEYEDDYVYILIVETGDTFEAGELLNDPEVMIIDFFQVKEIFYETGKVTIGPATLGGPAAKGVEG